MGTEPLALSSATKAVLSDWLTREPAGVLLTAGQSQLRHGVPH